MTTERDELRASLDNIGERLDKAVARLDGQIERKADRWPVRLAIAGLIGDLILSFLLVGALRDAKDQRENLRATITELAAEIEDRERADCENHNIGVTNIRVGIADALTESLVSASVAQGRTPDPAVITAYKADLTARLEALVPYRDCAAEAEARANDAPLNLSGPLE